MSSRRKQGFQLEVKQSGKVLNWKVLCMAAFWHEFFSYFFSCLERINCWPKFSDHFTPLMIIGTWWGQGMVWNLEPLIM